MAAVFLVCCLLAAFADRPRRSKGLAMLGSLSYLLGRLPFSHRVAQAYELLSAQRTTRRAGAAWLAAVASAGTAAPTSETNEWFRSSDAVSAQFVMHVKTRTNLEIGSGPMGHLASRPWMGRRIVIDPLIDAYRSYQLKRFGKTAWTDDIRTYSSPAEDLIPDLIGAVDGSIICRNALDHTEDPLRVLSAISRYAAPGCYLLLWTDIWHLRGLTIGHRNITKSAGAMDALLRGLGFEIIHSSDALRAPDEFIEYGRLARKLGGVKS